MSFPVLLTIAYSLTAFAAVLMLLRFFAKRIYHRRLENLSSKHKTRWRGYCETGCGTKTGTLTSEENKTYVGWARWQVCLRESSWVLMSLAFVSMAVAVALSFVALSVSKDRDVAYYAAAVNDVDEIERARSFHRHWRKYPTDEVFSRALKGDVALQVLDGAHDAGGSAAVCRGVNLHVAYVTSPDRKRSGFCGRHK